jgi:GTPase SAR1 family protein
MGQSFYRNTETCVLVFDLTAKESFDNIEIWRNNFLGSLNLSNNDNFPFILVGNKSDLKDDILVNDDEINDYCQQHNNMPYFATSAKEKINLEELFSKVAELAVERYNKNENENSDLAEKKFVKVKVDQKKKKCCGK